MRPTSYLFFFLAGLLFTSFSLFAAQSPRPTSLDFIKGHTLIVPHVNPDTLPKLRQSMQALADTKANFVCLAVMAEMPLFDKPQINWGKDYYGFTDEMLLQTIQLARDLRLKIVLKPMVNCKDDTWRSWIEFTDPDGDQDLVAWNTWWDQYQEFILHYVDVAQQTGCEMFCLGCEMGSTEGFEVKWRNLIKQARQKYQGLLTYNSNHDHYDYVHFWDVLDVISVSAYFNLGQYMADAGIANAKDPNTPVGVEEVKVAWKAVADKLAPLSQRLNKPIFFIECGICSADNMSRTPWEHPSPKMTYNAREQADFYRIVMETFWDQPWFVGVTWWDWPAFLYPVEQGKTDISFAIHGKPAEEVVRTWYAKPKKPIQLSAAKDS